MLIPARDTAHTLPTALRSVERQSERRFECVVVDDGSVDETPSIVETFSRRDERFTLVRRPHGGIVAALNAGLTACRAAFVARFDADDIMHKGRLRAQLDALEHDEVLSGVGCHVRVFPRRALTDGLVAYERWLNGLYTADDIERDAFVECPLAHPSWMLRREVMALYGYRDVAWAEDYDLLLRLLSDGHKIGVVARRFLLWREHSGRLWRTGPRYRPEQFVACKAHYIAQGLLRREATYVLWGYGDTGRRLARALEAEHRRPSHIVELHPGRLGQRIHGAPVVPPERLRELGGVKVVASVAGVTARAEIRAALADMGFVERRDYVCAA